MRFQFFQAKIVEFLLVSINRQSIFINNDK